jgi:hypothetical protein
MGSFSANRWTVILMSMIVFLGNRRVSNRRCVCLCWREDGKVTERKSITTFRALGRSIKRIGYRSLVGMGMTSFQNRSLDFRNRSNPMSYNHIYFLHHMPE